MRISDWSSDVCSSDLHGAERETGHGFGMGGEHSTVFLEQQFSCMLGSFNAQIMTPLIKSVWKRSGDWSNVPARLWAVLMCSRATPSQIERRSEEHTSELKSLMRISYAVFCLNKKKQQ